MPTPVQQPSLVGGELSKTLTGRVDIERYKQGLELCENFIVHPHGGVENRSGSEYVAKTKLQDGSAVRLITFQPSVGEPYVIELGHQYLRLHDSFGPVKTDGNLKLVVNDSTGNYSGYIPRQSLTGYDAYFGQGFIGDAVNPFRIGKLGVKFLRDFQTKFLNAKVAIYDNNAGVPGSPVAGLGFDDFSSLADLGINDIPHPGTNIDSIWKYFKLRSTSVGGPTFAPGTTLHLVIKLEKNTATDQVRLYLTTRTGLLNGMSPNYIPEVPGGVWQATLFSGSSFEIGVFNDDPEAIVELSTPWSSGVMDEAGTESQIHRLVVAQSVDVMTFADGTKKSIAYELRRLFGSWELASIPVFVSVGAPSAVTFDIGTTQPALEPTRLLQYAVTGVTLEGKESLPLKSAVFSVGSDISTTVPFVLLITVGDEVVDHYNIYKGLDGTFGYIGSASNTRSASEVFKSAYNAAYKASLDAQLALIGSPPTSHGSTTNNTNTVTPSKGLKKNQNKALTAAEKNLMIATAQAAGQAAGNAAMAELGAGGVTPNFTTLRFADENNAPDNTDDPPNGANPFTSEGGATPACVAYFQQRLCFANVLDRPDTIFMSEVSDYRSFQRSIPTVDDDSIEATLAQGQLNEIRFMVPMRDLLVLTTGGEHIVTGGGKPVTPSNLDAPGVSQWGCGTLHPLVIGNVILFKDRGGHIREWLYDQNSNDYPATDVGMLALHLFQGYRVMGWSYVSSPTSVIHAVRSDGTLLTFTYVRAQSVAAWARQVTSGKYRSITAVRDIESDGETLYHAVQRTLNGVDSLCIEKSKPRNSTDSPFSDCAVVTALDSQAQLGESSGEPNWSFQFGGSWTQANAAGLVLGAVAQIKVPLLVFEGAFHSPPVLPDFAGIEKRWIVLFDADENRYTVRILSMFGVGFETTYDVLLDTDLPATMATCPEGGSWQLGAKRFVGLDHLVGETVAVRADAGVHNQLVVAADGSIDLDVIANQCAAGLPFVSTIRTLPLAISGSDVKTKQKLVSSVGVDIVDSKGVWAGESLDSLFMKKPEIPDPTSPETGRIEIRGGNRWNRGGQIYVQQRDPVSCMIAGVSPEVTLGG